jgi:hypothetical protein
MRNAQRLVSIVKMATMLEVCTTEKHCFVVLFLWVKELSAKDIYKETFLGKAVYSLVEKRGQTFR